MNWLGRYNFFRSYGFGAPFDRENADRERTTIDNFKQYVQGSPLQQQFRTSVTENQLSFERVFFPLAGLCVLPQPARSHRLSHFRPALLKVHREVLRRLHHLRRLLRLSDTEVAIRQLVLRRQLQSLSPGDPEDAGVRGQQVRAGLVGTRAFPKEDGGEGTAAVTDIRISFRNRGVLVALQLLDNRVIVKLLLLAVPARPQVSPNGLLAPELGLVLGDRSRQDRGLLEGLHGTGRDDVAAGEPCGLDGVLEDGVAVVLESGPFQGLLLGLVVLDDEQFRDECADIGHSLSADVDVGEGLELDPVDELFDLYFFGLVLVLVLGHEVQEGLREVLGLQDLDVLVDRVHYVVDALDQLGALAHVRAQGVLQDLRLQTVEGLAYLLPGQAPRLLDLLPHLAGDHVRALAQAIQQDPLLRKLLHVPEQLLPGVREGLSDVLVLGAGAAVVVADVVVADAGGAEHHLAGLAVVGDKLLGVVDAASPLMVVGRDHYYCWRIRRSIMQKKDLFIGKKIGSYVVAKKLGEGSFGVVYMVVDSAVKQRKFAAKIVRKSELKDPSLIKLMQTEVHLLSRISNENVISYVDYYESKDYCFLITEYCNGGDLLHYVDSVKQLSESEAVGILKQIVNGLRAIHGERAMHRDLKLENILRNNQVVKIADLGFSKILDHDMELTYTSLGTPLVMAPEILTRKPYGLKADIWSVGVIYYYMLFGRYPFEGQNIKDLVFNIFNKPVDLSPTKRVVSPDSKQFLLRCLEINVDKRYSWRQIYESSLFAEGKQFLTQTEIFSSLGKAQLADNKQYYEKYEYETPGEPCSEPLESKFKFKTLEISLEDAETVDLGSLGLQNERHVVGVANLFMHERNKLLIPYHMLMSLFAKSKIENRVTEKMLCFLLTKQYLFYFNNLLRKMDSKVKPAEQIKCWEEFRASVYYERLSKRLLQDYESLVQNRIDFSTGLEKSHVAKEIASDSLGSQFAGQLREVLVQYYFDLYETYVREKEAQSRLEMGKLLLLLLQLRDIKTVLYMQREGLSLLQSRFRGMEQGYLDDNLKQSSSNALFE